MRRQQAACLQLWTLGFALLPAGPTLAKDYLDESRIIPQPPQSTTERFTFTLEKNDPPPQLDLAIHLTQGRAEVRILDPGGRKLQHIGAQICTVSQQVEGATTPGTYAVELTTTEGVGRCHLRIYDGSVGRVPSKAHLGPGLVASSAMMLVAIASVWFWRGRTGVAWRWFWVGAGVWAVAVAVKFAIAIPLQAPIFEGLKGSLPRWAFLTAGTIYGGLMTGITEVLFTLIAALIWRQMAAAASRGVAVGVGAGAFEAALLGIVFAVAAIAAGAGAPTWGVVLVPGAERLLAILCHTASRALVLLAVARRRWVLFWYGFLLLSGVDALATILHLTGWMGTVSPWAIEGLLAPFGLASIPITIWCIRHWPSRPAAAAGPPTEVPADVGDAGARSAE